MHHFNTKVTPPTNHRSTHLLRNDNGKRTNDIQKILKQLSIAVKGSEQEYYTDKELCQFAQAFRSKWTDGMSDNEVADGFLDYWWNTDKPVEAAVYMRTAHA